MIFVNLYKGRKLFCTNVLRSLTSFRETDILPVRCATSGGKSWEFDKEVYLLHVPDQEQTSASPFV